jgi:hypothetical protein
VTNLGHWVLNPPNPEALRDSRITCFEQGKSGPEMVESQASKTPASACKTDPGNGRLIRSRRGR